MDRVTDFESGGWGFDSLWGRCDSSARGTRNSCESGYREAEHDHAVRIDHDRMDEKGKSIAEFIRGALFVLRTSMMAIRMRSASARIRKPGDHLQ